MFVWLFIVLLTHSLPYRVVKKCSIKIHVLLCVAFFIIWVYLGMLSWFLCAVENVTTCTVLHILSYVDLINCILDDRDNFRDTYRSL